MYFRKLFRYHKFLFFAIAGFFCIQLYLNSKRGLTATPFLHYGMYSGRMEVPEEIEAWVVEVDGRPLRWEWMHPKKADVLLNPLIVYSLPRNIGVSLYDSHIRRFLSAAHLPSKRSQYDPTLPREAFARWYLRHAGRVLGKEAREVKVYYNVYRVSDSGFQFSKQSVFLYAHH